MGKAFVYTVILSALAVCPALAQQKKAPAENQQKKAKAKAEKVSGDIGLLDLEKNYMIVVTKEGKLVTVDFDNKTKVTKFVPQKAKMSDINLGQAATISYKTQNGKNSLDSIDVKVKAKKGE